MQVFANSTYRDMVFHSTIWFSKPECINYIGDWSVEWKEMFELLQTWVADNLLAHGYGILQLNITKLEPITGEIFKVDIIYWQQP